MFWRALVIRIINPLCPIFSENCQSLQEAELLNAEDARVTAVVSLVKAPPAESLLPNDSRQLSRRPTARHLAVAAVVMTANLAAVMVAAVVAAVRDGEWWNSYPVNSISFLYSWRFSVCDGCFVVS